MRTPFDFELNPWRMLDAMLGEMPGPQPGAAWRFPRVNAWEGDNGLMLEAELPGVDPQQVDVSVNRNELVIKGRRPVLGGEADEMREFERRFELPFEVDPESVQARSRHGILQLNLPKAPSAQKRRIAVEAA